MNQSAKVVLVTLAEASDVFPVFQHDGLEFLYMLEGEVGYRHGEKVYVLTPGDSLFLTPMSRMALKTCANCPSGS